MEVNKVGQDGQSLIIKVIEIVYEGISAYNELDFE